MSRGKQNSRHGDFSKTRGRDPAGQSNPTSEYGNVGSQFDSNG